MGTSKFQGVTLVYCMEQIRDAMTIRSLSQISYNYIISFAYQYRISISLVSVSNNSRSDIIASLIVLDALHNKNHVYIYNNNKNSYYMFNVNTPISIMIIMLY